MSRAALASVLLLAIVPGATGANGTPGPASGDKIAYVAIPVCWIPEMGGCLRMVTISDVSGPRVVIVRQSGRDRGPVWSPDGGTLAFSSRGKVYAVDQNALHLRSLGAGNVDDWTADGTKLVVTEYPGTIVVIDPAGRELGRFTAPLESVGWARWSPDAGRILYSACCVSRQRFALFVLDVRTGESRMLDRGSSGSWSPDGTAIVYRSEESDSSARGVYVIRSDGTGRRRLDDGYVGNARPWSPDGRMIVYTHWPLGDDAVYTIAPDGTERRRVTTTNAWDPTFSPDGRRIAFSRVGGGPRVINVDGTGEQPIPNESMAQDSLTWQPATAELSVSAGRPRNVAAGKVLRAPITVRNRGAAAAADVVLEVRVPPQARVVGAVRLCQGTRVLTCRFARLQPGESRLVQPRLRFVGAGATAIGIAVHATGFEPNPTDNRRELRIRVSRARK